MSPLRKPRVLWIATKSPFPATDGGRLVTASTLDALTDEGVEITVVCSSAAESIPKSAPRQPEYVADRLTNGIRLVVVQAAPASWPRAAALGLRAGHPVSVARHTSAAVTARIADLVRTTAFDIVHIEQPQALVNAAPALAAGLASVLRAQNVESLVWAAATSRHTLLAPLFRLEARRFRHFEASALTMVDQTMALSTTDATRLAMLAPSAADRITCVPPPFIAGPAADIVDTGNPTFTWIGSAGWPVNDDAVEWLVADVWPEVARRVPEARLRLFGQTRAAGGGRDGGRAAEQADANGIARHPAPDDCSVAFTPGTILLLPLRTAAGVRMRLLDAWARGVPAVATPAAVDGLDTADERDVLIAADAHGFAEACARLARDGDLRARLVAGGRATLARRHDPATVARAMIAVYDAAIARCRAGRHGR